MELRVGGKYRLTKRIGSGAFCDIYHGMICTFMLIWIGVDVKTNEEVAVKLVFFHRNILGTD